MHPLLGTWPAKQAHAQTGNQTGDPLVCRLALNPLSHASQAIGKIFLKSELKNSQKKKKQQQKNPKSSSGGDGSVGWRILP